MRKYILLLLSCVSVAAADTGIRMFTSTSKDNATPGGIVTTETYTRDGEQDLIRITKSLNGALTYQSHAFYHGGKLVALYTWHPEYSTFNVVPGLPYYVGVEFLPSKDIKSLTIQGNDFKDGFYTTNGLFYPVPDSALEISPAK
jgi:hypothetical protein